MKKLILTVLVLLASNSALAQTSSYLSGSLRYTNPNGFDITANTADGADANHMVISGGGGGVYDPDRGAAVIVFGNEYAGVEAGTAEVISGTDSYVDLISKGASSEIRFKPNSYLNWHMDPGAFGISVLRFGGNLVGSNETAYIAADTPDGTDDGQLILSGGGGPGSATRGATLILDGNDRGGAGTDGSALLRSGDNGPVTIETSGTAAIGFYTDLVQRLSIANTGAAHQNDIYFGSGQDDEVTTLRHVSSDGHDGQQLNLCAGGACGYTRGAEIDLRGDDYGGGGNGGDVLLKSGDLGGLYIYTRNELKWSSIASGTGVYEWRFGPVGATGTNAYIMANSTNGADSEVLHLVGGGAATVGRGGMINIQGEDVGGVGAGGGISILPGTNANALIESTGTGHVSIHDGTGPVWTQWGSTGSGSCTFVSQKYANININSVAVKIALCD